MKTKLELSPLYRANVSFSRRLGIYKVTLFIGRKRATSKELRKFDMGCDFRSFRDCTDNRYYISEIETLESLVSLCVKQNKS